MMLSTITLTLFLQNVQQSVFDYSSDLAVEISEHASSINQGIETLKIYNELYNYVATSKIGNTLGLEPNDNPPLENLTVLDDKHTSIELARLLKILSWFMLISSIFLIFSILYSIIWLSLDLRFGKHKWITLCVILLSILFNFLIHDHVVKHIDLL